MLRLPLARKAGGGWRGACAQCEQRLSGPCAWMDSGGTECEAHNTVVLPAAPHPKLSGNRLSALYFFFFWRQEWCALPGMVEDFCLAADADARPAHRPAHASRRVGSCASCAFHRTSFFGLQQWSRSRRNHSEKKESTTPGRIETLEAPGARELVRSWSYIPGEPVAPAATTTRCGALGLRGEMATPMQGVSRWYLLPVVLNAVPFIPNRDHGCGPPGAVDAPPGEAGRWAGARNRIRACVTGHGHPAVMPALTFTQPRALKKRRAAPVRAMCQTLAAVLTWGFLSMAAAKVCDIGTWFDADCNIQIEAGPHGPLAMQINWTSAVAYPG